MASFKLNFARIRGCPAPRRLAEAMESFGLPESGEFGVLQCTATDQALFATIVRRTQQAVTRLDPQTRELAAVAVERAVSYVVGVKPGAEVLELYTGSPAAIEQVGTFLSGGLGLATVVEGLEVDVLRALEKLQGQAERFQLRAARVTDYAHNSYLIGPYSPKFSDTQHGMDFLARHAEAIASASVRFQGPSGRVHAMLTPRACFTYSCNEDDQSAVQALLRKLL